ncbi:MAG: tetratricopeptide repeat protein [Elusimicrobia bacterium]|nr:tetratricopeptide repeat protein [Elusimicrobiota bacterium]
MRSPSAEFSRRLFEGGLAACAALLVYANSLPNGFTFDDHALVENNAFVQDPRNLKHLADPRFYLRPHAVTAGSRPILLASLLVDRALWSGNASGYHLSSVLLHAANTAWVYVLGAMLLPGSSALVAALAFALHPAATEAVDAVAFRSDLLAAFFVFAGLFAYLRARTAPALVAASALALGLGLLSKESAAVLPLLAGLSEWSFPEPAGRRKRMLAAAVLYAAVGLAFVSFWTPRYGSFGIEFSPARRALQRAFASAPSGEVLPLPPVRGGAKAPPSAPSWTAFYSEYPAWAATLAGAVAGYAGRLAWPSVWVVDRGLAVLRPGTFRGAAALLFALAMSAGAIALAVRRRPAGFGAAWCLVALLPVSGLVPLVNPVADRYLYLVLAGFAWALGAAYERFRKRIPWALAAAVLAAWGARTFMRNLDWRSDETLFLNAPEPALSPRARYTRAVLLSRLGDLPGADRELKAAVTLHPGFAEGWLALGTSEAGRDPGAAREHLELAVSLSPSNPVFRFALGGLHAAAGRSVAALEAYREAVRLDPDYVEAWVNLGALYRDLKRNREAEEAYRRAIALAGADPVPYVSYGLFLERTGRRDEAAAYYAAALSRRKGYPPAAQGLDRLSALRRR